jgi:hypothetical protein
MRLSNILKVGGRIVAVCAAVVVMAQPVLAQRGPVSKPAKKNAAAAKAKDRQQLQASTWLTIQTAAIPAAVMASKQRTFPKAKITKAEHTGAGEAAFYRLSFAGGRARQVTFAADGTIK